MAEQDNEVQKKEPAKNQKQDSDNLLAILSYLGILVLVPYLINQDKKNEFIAYHVKQGIVLAIAGLLLMAVRWMLPGGGYMYWGFYGTGGSWLFALVGLVQLGILVLAVIGILNVLQGQKKQLPVLGKYADNLKI
jgi:uncharacterized membrane protein